MAGRTALSLSALAALVTAQGTTTSSIEWWPGPPFQTWSSGPISPHRGHPEPTTSLTGVSSYTYTSSAVSTAIPTTYANATSSAAPSATSLPACKSIQYAYPSGQGSNAERADAIKEMYLYSWNAYVADAFGHDELLPLNASYIDDWYGWGVTIVDGIDTAIVMGLTDVVEKMLTFISTIDFTTTPDGPVEVFDTNIRYLGGLLSSYDLLKSGQFENSYAPNLVDALLSQAIVLADKLAYAFITPTGLASSNLNFNNNTQVYGTYTVAATNVTYNATNTASTGTWVLEWARLSDLTGNETYRYLTERANSYLVNPNPAPVYPGLVGTEFDVDTGDMITFDGGWHSGVDSFLEYLIKDYYYKITPTTTQYKDFWLTAVQSTAEYIALHPYGWPDLTFISSLDVNGSIEYTQDDYSCFMGGNLMLGGTLLDMPEIVTLGLAAADGCHQTYNTTLTGLGPITWSWFNESNLAYDSLDDDDTIEHKLVDAFGFWIPEGDERYEFFPESIESFFYAHRISGDPRWAEYQWQIAQALNTTARNNVAFATVENVNMRFGGTMGNQMDSFWFAEVLKYLYLSFTDVDTVSLDQWVFNTECHPMLVQCGIGGVDDYVAGNATASS